MTVNSAPDNTCGGCAGAIATTVPAFAGLVHCTRNLTPGYSAYVSFISPTRSACGSFLPRKEPLVFPQASEYPAPQAEEPARVAPPAQPAKEDNFPADLFL